MRRFFQSRIICSVVAVSVLFGFFPALRVNAAAELEERRVLDCHFEAPTGEGYAGYAVHVHTVDDCYDSYYELCCPLPYIPPHVHTEACYQTEKILTCGRKESADHHHDDVCYEEKKELVCGELELHTHTGDCYTDGMLTCGLPELQEHVHGDECFKKVIVDIDPDTGEETVISEPEADLETEEDWEASVAGAELTGDWNRDLVAVAETQLGYARSIRRRTLYAVRGLVRVSLWGLVRDVCVLLPALCRHPGRGLSL